MGHMADCMQQEPRNEKHEQMIELIIVFLKHLLLVPEDQNDPQGLQKKMLLQFGEESALDSFIFIAQHFDRPFERQMAMHLLEIQFLIFKGFTPEQLFREEGWENDQIRKILQKERAQKKELQMRQGPRHSKFGTCLQVMRKDGSSYMVSNIYGGMEDKAIEKRQRKKPKGLPVKLDTQKITAE